MNFLDGTYPSVEAPTSTSSPPNKTYFLLIHIFWISLNLSTGQWDSPRFVPSALWLLARSGLTEHPCSKLFSFDFKSLKMVFQPGPGSRDSRSKWPSAHQPPSPGQSTPVWIPLWLVFHSVLRLLSQTQLPFLLFLQLKSHFWFCSFFKFSLLLTPALTHSGMHTCTNTGKGMCAHSTSLGRKSWWLS